MDLFRRSIEVIQNHQSSTGAYVASPNFPMYAFCWLRDGSFTAYAMDRVGQHESARSFFYWAARTIQRHGWKVKRILEMLKQGKQPREQDYLHTRYTLQGEETKNKWWNFQLDGYGTWLWALNEHWVKSGDEDFIREMTESIDLPVNYLSALWNIPNYDCWEENPDSLHPYTLAAIYAGLRAAEKMTQELGLGKRAWAESNLPESIRRFIVDHGVRDGVLVKKISLPLEKETTPNDREPAVDASLVGVAIPYCLLSPEDPIVQTTIARIETDLHRPGGGVYRYRTDTYFGGGEWILLSAWLGWYYIQTGELEKANTLLKWIENQADEQGYLPEQVTAHLLIPDRYAEWESRWGPVAKPLLWSHAMYLILYQALAEAQ